MEDIELARCLLEEQGLNLTIAKEGKVLFTSRERGLHPLLQAVLSTGDALHGAAMADNIVGAAAAMLCLHARIASVYTHTASTRALALLQRQGVNVASENMVPYILNRDGTDLCPFEKLAQSASKPSQLLSSLKSFFAEGNQ